MGSFNLIIKEWVVCVEKIWTIGANRGSNWSYDDLKNILEAVGRVGMNGSFLKKIEFCYWFGRQTASHPPIASWPGNVHFKVP